MAMTTELLDLRATEKGYRGALYAKLEINPCCCLCCTTSCW
jgi:hypothetical protein